MGIDIQTLFILYAILNLSTIFIFTFFLFSIKEKGDALVLYIITCLLICFEWLLAGSRNPLDLPYKVVLSNGIVFLAIGYSFYCLIIANQKFQLKEFLQMNALLLSMIIVFSFFVNKPESVRIAVASLIAGLLFLLGSIMLFRRINSSKLQVWVGVIAFVLSLIHFYRFYYALKIDPEITLFKDVFVNSATFILYFIESLSVGVIILMIHYEHSKQKIQKDNRLLVEVNATRDKILSVIAHDLKNYFNALLGLSSYFDSVEDWETIGSQRKKITLINGVSQSAYLLLSNLLEWANAKRKKIVFQPRQFAICEVVNQVVEVCKSEAEIKEILLNISCPEDLLVCADQNMVRTILRNLLFNAIKYSYRNNKIDLQLEKLDDRIKIVVKDYGIGMSSDEIIRLLSEDVFVSKPGTEKERGSGFGLQICKEFIRLHKSKLNIESKLKSGTQFWFYLTQNCSS